jgi:cytochrome bd-type quinol oxidase subunit 2
MDELSFSLYLPLIFLGLAYLVVLIAAQPVRARGNKELAERMLDISFGLALLAGVYVVVLLLISLVSEPDLIYDMLSIMLVVAVFFAVLLLVLFGLFELVFSRGGRKRKASPEETSS